MLAIYDLSRMPTTFDFAAWAVLARTAGAKAVHFVVDGPIADWKYPSFLAWKRFGNIVLPICNLAGLQFTVGSLQKGEEFPYHYGDVQRAFSETGRIVKLRQTYDVEPGYVTITLRKSFRNEFRNSNVEAWMKFKEYLEAQGKRVAVLPECEQAPLDVEYRMALYANAEMNFGASNGPLSLCHMSEAPYLTLNMAPADKTGKGYMDMESFMAKGGFPIGSNFSFRTARQALVWKPDTFENIVEAWEPMQ